MSGEHGIKRKMSSYFWLGSLTKLRDRIVYVKVVSDDFEVVKNIKLQLIVLAAFGSVYKIFFSFMLANFVEI